MAGVDIGQSIQNSIKAAGSVTTNAVNKVQSTFVGGVKEDLALIDAKAKSAVQTLNSFKDTQIGAIDGFIKKVSGGALSISELSSIIDVRNGISIDYQRLYRRLGDAAGFPMDSIIGMTADLKMEVANLLDAYSSKNYTYLLNKAGVKIGVNDSSYQAAQLIAGVISKMSKSDSDFNTMVDEAAQLALLNVMVRNAVQVGLWSGIDTLLGQYTDKAAGITNLATCAQISIRGGDVFTTKYIIDTVGIARVTALNTDFLTDMLRYFKFKSDVTADQYANYLATLTYCLQQAEADWAYMQFGTVRALRLKPFTNASTDAITLFQHTDEYRQHVMIARTYPPRDLMDLLKQNYPYMAVVQ
ncbi:hypothetical protein RAY_160 [Erwinia phage vB_EamM_RAY]|uniref:Uncharacterized protein n=10 Tax=Agricanvirus TaxID=1984776 RepID=A0A173GE10_9CAUD|nr:hypothetical protein Ea357_159 [Erwinia phage Ea35-70]YP_009605308.1 hypothetical protein FDH97_gp165 [Erwinia phage vB_EamM_Deimos-Minion]YP_009605627.1 hypothetical protein FDH98_gp160 [Erwinia phage vB_EamM_RAY]YP_009605947.1 hypothetical protein FDH99_gp163 [Erwinia phage vB_EamM_Simmy50]YP_009606268.1 hypothetical protein FDI00_gp162 [Erwinia phage vB_EamM_Special G]YP_009621901.1 hypothetical protein FDJ23_gp160 [Erwinia phage vB_EamM_Desertfox]AUG85948.1 hypothetical protein BOSOLAP